MAIDMSTVTIAQIILARGWIADCEWGDLAPRRVAQLSRDVVVRGVERHYEGGWAQFVVDNS